VVGRNPALVICLIVTTGCALTTGKRFLLNRSFRLLGSSRLLGLREESLNVCLVDEVAGATEDSRQEQI
jgi:hypothetical protein